MYNIEKRGWLFDIVTQWISSSKWIYWSNRLMEINWTETSSHHQKLQNTNNTNTIMHKEGLAIVNLNKIKEAILKNIERVARLVMEP